MYSYSCGFFVCFRSYIFVREQFEQKLTSLHVVEVSARSEQYCASGERSKFFFRREWRRAFPGVSVWDRIRFHNTYLRLFLSLICVFILLGAQPKSPINSYITTAACREHAYPQLTTKLQPCRPEAAAGSTMRVWQIRAVLRMPSCSSSPCSVRGSQQMCSGMVFASSVRCWALSFSSCSTPPGTSWREAL